MKRSARLSVLFVIAVLLVSLAGCKDLFVPAEEGSGISVDEALVPPPDEAPFVVIDSPEGYGRIYPAYIGFGWHSGLETDPKRVRYLLTLNVNHDGIYDVLFNLIVDLNANPEYYEDMWSRWYPYNAANEMGRKVIIGDDEELLDQRAYVFAVQAMDRRGNVTLVFRKDQNTWRFYVSKSRGPCLYVSEPLLGEFNYYGSGIGTQYAELAPGIPVNFSWEATADEYGGEIAGYRYGWDIEDISDPNQWATDFSLDNVSAPEAVFESGIHTFYVQAADTWGNSMTGAIEITIVP